MPRPPSAARAASVHLSDERATTSDFEIDNDACQRSRNRPDKALGRAEMRALLECKLDELPEAFRSVFVLRSVEELSVEETAQSLGIPEATVRSRHFRAKSLLRESLAQEIDLAERDVFEFGGCDCDRIVAKVTARLGWSVSSATQTSLTAPPAPQD